ncbi:glycosyltransferase family 2 protein [Diaphorobacter caeni]|uniref:glycosyltransferase family 2 protein n=1 Tax=Diaphorobacter caeni TaxID=2784387 RepID=UPI00188ED920|nr:glycosyltransferase family 2 protein [Diaphorobacter caeni]MBF5003508.1 glycosyltransferase family 2 protein [Diaphorobacter caeni]
MPRVSIIMAAYGRPHLLKWAIESIQKQTITDWELLVVSDACPHGTAETAQIFADADERIRVIQLARNWGEQSGPNNVGLARSSAPLVAFLNQDDLWFPDHLELLIDGIDAAGADIAFGASAHMGLPPNGDMRCCPSSLAGMGDNGRYCPVKTFAPMSAWLVKRRCLERIGTLPRAADCIAESSQTWLFKAWKHKLKITAVPELTCLIFSSGNRANSYLNEESSEQAYFGEQIRCNPYLRARILVHASPSYRPESNPRKELFQFHFKKLQAKFGLFPRAVEFWFKHGRRSGDYIRYLRSVRGLPSQTSTPANHPQILRRRWIERHCTYELGTRIDCSESGQGERHLRDGWCLADAAGSLMFAPTVSLHFRLQSLNAQASRLVMHWQLPTGAILYASLNGAGIPLASAIESDEPPNAAEWVWNIPRTATRSLDFEIHTPTPGCRLVRMRLD